jgi:hypothetical protein
MKRKSGQPSSRASPNFRQTIRNSGSLRTLEGHYPRWVCLAAAALASYLVRCKTAAVHWTVPLHAQMDPLLLPNTFAAARKYRVRLQLLKMHADRLLQAVCLPCTIVAPARAPVPLQTLCVLCYRIQGPQDDAAFGFVGPDADKMRSGADLAAGCGPWLMLQDLAGVPMNLPDVPVVVGSC